MLTEQINTMLEILARIANAVERQTQISVAQVKATEKVAAQLKRTADKDDPYADAVVVPWPVSEKGWRP